jgi:tetratricopeptide (TPR) repeat protein
LGVFVGGCTIAAAQQVCNADRALGNDIVDEIAMLVGSSLLQRHEGKDGRSRFGMLETVHEYAMSQLVASGEATAIQQRHAAYYLALAEAAEQEWDGPDEWAWLRRLVSVRDNLRSALRWALDTRDAALALRLNGALFSFWTTCSVLTEARDWIDAALALPIPSDAPELAIVEAKVLSVAGYIAAATSDLVQASAYFERSRAQYRAVGDPRGMAWSIRGSALVYMLRKEYTAAEQLDDESLRLCRSSGDAWGLAWSLYTLAFLKLAQGDLVQAQPALHAALAQLRQQSMPFGAFRTLLALGHTRFEQGDLVRAEALYREGLALCREAPFLTIITTGLEGLAMVVAARGQPLRAARLRGAAEALREMTDEWRWQSYQHAYARALAAARAEVAAADWTIAWAAGRALTAAQAIAEALDDADVSLGFDEPSPLIGSNLI